ncbi:MAG: cytochrome c biogenesis protein ResB [Anaeromyxobacter sp.]
MSEKTIVSRLWDALTSLKLTIVCLAALMALVVACTLAQVHLGTWASVERYMRSWLVWWELPGTVVSLPIFPGGALAGLVLGLNLISAQLRRLELSAKKAGIWIVHAGLILLVAGEFVTGMFQEEHQLIFEEGQTTNFVESPRKVELALIDSTDPALDDVYGVPERTLSREGDVAIPGTPLTLRVHRWYQNASLFNLQPGLTPAATAGVGTQLAIEEAPPVTTDDRMNDSAALVEPVADGRSYGTWLVSNALGAPQSFVHEGHTYQLTLRSQREYLPFTMTLRDFKHDVYPGTDTPKNFSSLVHLQNPGSGESRDVLIYMNQPLRYAGKAFYQASFGKGDTLSILQVVENPGWLLPYVSCVLVTLGLLVHFGISLRRALRRQGAGRAAPAAAPTSSTPALEA